MAKPKKYQKSSESARIKALEKENKALLKENKELEKALEWADLKRQVYEKMVDIAERDLHLPIRKKYGTKQSEK